MESPSQKKQASLKWTQNNNRKQNKNHERFIDVRKSTDSLYKQLQFTPNQEQKFKNEQEKRNSPEIFKQTLLFMQNNQNDYKVNLTSQFQNLHQNSTNQQKNIFYKGSIRNSQNMKKPSTPTFNTKSSLNFLKHRKQQIIMNQALGLTLNNLQNLRKSRSKSRQQSQKSKSSSQKISTLPNFKNTGITEQLKNLSNLIEISQKSKKNSKKNTRSFSTLQRMEAILNGSFQRTDSQFQIEKFKIYNNYTSLSQRARSMNNSLRSSRSQSNQSFELQNLSNHSRSRSNLLNSINQKLNQAKLLKNFALVKQKREKKVNKQKQINLVKRLNSLEMILSQLESKSIKNKQQKPKNISQSTGRNFQVIGAFRNQINQINQRINLFENKDFQLKKVQNQKKTINQVNHNLGPNNHFRPIRSNSNIQYTDFNFKATNHQNQSIKILNHKPSSLLNQLSKEKIQDNKRIFRQAPVKVFFNYSNPNNIMAGPKILPDRQTLNDKQTFCQKFRFSNSKQSYPLSHQNIPIIFQSHHYNNTNLNSYQYPINFQINALNKNPHQQIKINNFSDINPHKIGTISNKSLSLKNKHALQVKNYSPLKNITVNGRFSKQNISQTSYLPK